MSHNEIYQAISERYEISFLQAQRVYDMMLMLNTEEIAATLIRERDEAKAQEIRQMDKMQEIMDRMKEIEEALENSDKAHKLPTVPGVYWDPSKSIVRKWTLLTNGLWITSENGYYVPNEAVPSGLKLLAGHKGIG